MVNLATGPITKSAYELCRMIDALPYASVELTAVSAAASAQLGACEELEKRIAELEAELKLWRASSCACVPDEEGTGFKNWCLPHARIRNKLAELEAEREEG